MASTTEHPSGLCEEGKFVRPLPPGSDDLVILARDEEFYLLKKEAYQTSDHVIPASMVSQAKLLVEQGVMLADIPVGSIPGVGAMCYLVNLGGFRRREPLPPPPTDGQASVNPPALDKNAPCLIELAPAVDDLMIVDRSRDTIYWVKRCEYQRTECRLDQLDPILEEQVRLLTNQGVVIADVPGGKLPGVGDMGCLVNLKGIHRASVKEELARQEETPKRA